MIASLHINIHNFVQAPCDQLGVSLPSTTIQWQLTVGSGGNIWGQEVWAMPVRQGWPLAGEIFQIHKGTLMGKINL